MRWSKEASGNGIAVADASTSCDPAVEAPSRGGEHVRALVEPRHLVPAGEEPLRDEAGPGRDVEHGAAVVGHARDERPPPAWILAEREHGADAVVVAAERREQTAGVAFALGHARTLPYPCAVSLRDDLERIAAAAALLAPEGASLTAVLAAEPATGVRGYLCAFEGADGGRSWVVLDDRGDTVTAGGSSVTSSRSPRSARSPRSPPSVETSDELLAQLVALRLTENPPGIDEAEAAVRALQRTIGSPPHLATPARLDDLGVATRRLEQALDPVAPVAVHVRAEGRAGNGRGAAPGGRGGVPRSAPTRRERCSRGYACGMEGGGFFPLGGDPEDILRGLREFAESQSESVKEAQREQFATLTLSTAVELTAAALKQADAGRRPG